MTKAVGPDVSRYNLSFDPTKATGPIDFAIQKATEGATYTDLLYEQIWQGVRLVPVRGAYHYQRSGVSWLAQADHFLRTAEKHDYHLHALDLEEYGNVYSDTYFADAKRIIDRWRNVSSGKVCLYTNGSTYDQLYLALLKLYGEAGAKWLDGVPLWIASPTMAGMPFLPKYRTNRDWLIHQYSWNGSPARWGTGGTRCDENVFYADVNTLHSYFQIDGEVPPENGEPMTYRYRATNLYPDMSLRADHNTGAALIARYPAGTVWYGDLTWTAPENLYNASGVQINKTGDVWLEVKQVAGAAKSGWVAVTHLGKVYCDPLTDNAPEPEPAPDVLIPDYLIAHYADGTERKYLPE